MPLRTYKPTSPGLRGMTRSTFDEITTTEPYKPLLEPQKRGPAATTRADDRAPSRRGEKTHYRRIDFKRDKYGVPARVATVEYDPNRVGADRPAPLPRRREARTRSCRTG